MCKRKGFFAGKRGVSVMVSYVLLVVFVIIIGAIVYQWLKTYVPAQALECPDGVSLFIKDADFDPSDSQLIITLRNNGRFSLAGYFIHATNSSDQELPTIDLSGYLNETQGPGIIFGNSVLFFEEGNNSFQPGSEKSYFFDIPSSIGEPYFIRIIPTRFQEVDERERFVSCGDARVGQLVGEVEECIPDCTGRVCGPDPVCGTSCGTCTVAGEVCDGTGQCVPVEECNDTCTSLEYECGNWTICGILTDCDSCEIGYSCNATGQCELNLGNGVCDPGETCADEPVACEGQQAQCEENYICQSGSCVLDISNVHSCPGYCVLLNYSTGFCTNSEGNCVSAGGIYEIEGDQWCTGGSQADTCCCTPLT